jgi:hypothetical protein
MGHDLDNLLAELESDASLFEPNQLRMRLEALDRVDAAGFEGRTGENGSTLRRATAMRDRLEAANATIYLSIRQNIGRPDGLMHWIDRCKEPGETAHGLGYDVLDELIAGVLPLPEPAEVVAPRAAEQVFYQPTPVRHLLEMIERVSLSPEDVLIDFGSGLGQLCIVSAILTGARAIGIEIDAAYVESAKKCAQDLGMERVSFVQADARDADLSTGSVFHLYTPFTGSILQAVLGNLREQARARPIRVSTLGPCAEIVAKEPWLEPLAEPDAERITIFRSKW